jgi:hypothetical protein
MEERQTAITPSLGECRPGRRPGRCLCLRTDGRTNGAPPKPISQDATGERIVGLSRGNTSENCDLPSTCAEVDADGRRPPWGRAIFAPQGACLSATAGYETSSAKQTKPDDEPALTGKARRIGCHLNSREVLRPPWGCAVCPSAPFRPAARWHAPRLVVRLSANAAALMDVIRTRTAHSARHCTSRLCHGQTIRIRCSTIAAASVVAAATRRAALAQIARLRLRAALAPARLDPAPR